MTSLFNFLFSDDFLNIFGSGIFITLLIWLIKLLIETRIKKSVDFEFSMKSAQFNSELKEREERLRAEVNSSTSDISTLRTVALSALSGRQAALDKRRLEAVEQLWNSVLVFGPVKTQASFFAVVSVEEACREYEKGGKMFLTFIDALSGDDHLKSPAHREAAKARPFVSPMAWAIYSAYSAIVGHTFAGWLAIKTRNSLRGMTNPDNVKELIKAALPNLIASRNFQDDAIIFTVFNDLEAALLAEIKKMLDGMENDEDSLSRASRIIELSNKILPQQGANPTP